MIIRSDKKLCKTCGVEKERGGFYAHPGTADGLLNECKECIKEKRKKKYWDDPSKARETKKKDYQKHREKRIAYVNRWTESNQEKVKINKRRYYDKNREVVFKRSAVHIQKRRAWKNNSNGSFTYNEWEALCNKYENKCLCCKKSKKLTMDHVVPLSRGGSNNIDNIQPLCLLCNMKKGTKTIDYR